MTSSFFGGRRSWDDDLERRLNSLSKEIAALSRGARRHGSHAYDGTRDHAVELYEDIAERLHDMMPHLRKKAHMAERTARENPALVLAGLAVVGIAAAALLRK